jgi:hypothetical protein
LAKERGTSLAAVRDEFEAEFPEFKVLADIANASKHFELDRSGPRQGLSAVDFHIGRGAAFSDGTYWRDGTTDTGAPDVVRMEFGAERIDLLNLCGRCLAYLETKV